MTDFFEIGRRAYRDGAPPAPILNDLVMEAIADLPVGGGAAAIFREFTRGWNAERNERNETEEEAPEDVH